MHSRPPTLTPVDLNKAYCFWYTLLRVTKFERTFWKGAKFAGSVGHPITKMLSASGGLRPDQGLCRQTPVISSCSALAMVPPHPLTPSAAYAVLSRRSIVCSSDLSNKGPPRPCLGPALQSPPDPPPGAVPPGPPLRAPPDLPYRLALAVASKPCQLPGPALTKAVSGCRPT